MECKYHRILEKLHYVICDLIDIHYIADFFEIWIWDTSQIHIVYKEVFEEILEEPLTDEQLEDMMVDSLPHGYTEPFI